MSDPPTSTPASNSLISWTVTGQNKLKEYELITRGTNIKLDVKGKNFTEWNEAVATHAKSMSMNDFFPMVLHVQILIQFMTNSRSKIRSLSIMVQSVSNMYNH